MKITYQSLTLLSPAPGFCQISAVNHHADTPHDATSLDYGVKFTQEHGRSPTWHDSMAHCAPEVRTAWEAE